MADVLRTPEERDDAAKRHEGDADAGRVVEPTTSNQYTLHQDRTDLADDSLDPKDYTITEIQDMDLNEAQLRSLLEKEKASANPRVSLIAYLEEELEESTA